MSHRRRRLTLSVLAVVLGVAFVSGALVLAATLGGSYTSLAARAHAQTDVSVAPADRVSAQGYRRRCCNPSRRCRASRA